jgi:ATP adenylyltransferase
MEHLWSPWRMTYLRGSDPADAERQGRRAGPITGTGPLPGFDPLPGVTCIFCDLPAQNRDAANLIVRRGRLSFVILNRYPYNNGHLMVVPYAHVPSLEQLDAPTLAEIMSFVNQALATLRRMYHPDAFNLGANIGSAAGAGIADHVHMHIVPRWSGDTNFMSTVAGTRVIPEELSDTFRQARDLWVAPAA